MGFVLAFQRQSMIGRSLDLHSHINIRLIEEPNKLGLVFVGQLNGTGRFAVLNNKGVGFQWRRRATIDVGTHVIAAKENND
jgi:hypothetical protein